MSNKPISPNFGSAPSPKERGKRAFRTGHYAEAVVHWSAVVEPDESLKQALAEAHFRQAAALHLDLSSLPHLLSATQLIASDPIYAYWYAVALHKAGRIQEALTEYQRAGSLGLAQAAGAAQRNPQLNIWLAQRSAGQIGAWPEPSAQAGDPRNTTPRMIYDALVLLARNDDDGTKKAVARLSEMSPKPLPRDVGAQRYAYLGVGHARRGHTALAIENWRLAARTWPTHALVRHNLASGALAQIHEAMARGDTVTAQKLAIEASTVDPTLTLMLSGLHYGMALSAARESRWADAARQLDRVAQSLTDAKGAERRYLLHNLALLYEMAEDWPAAAISWRELLRTLPRGKRTAAENTGNDQRAWIRRRAIDCYKRADQLDEAIKVLRQSVKQASDDMDTRLDLVRALYANDQEQAAENEAQRLLTLNPNHIDTLLQLGEMQLESEKFQQAEKNLDHAMSIAPEDRRVRAGLAEVLHQRAHFDERTYQPEKAITHFERAMHYAPDDLALMVCASRAYSRSDQLDKGRTLINHMLSVGKGKANTYYNAARFWAEQRGIAEIELVLQQAEQAGVLDARLLGLIGMDILDTVYPEPPRFLFEAMMRRYGAENLMMNLPLMRRPSEPTDPGLRDFGHALLHRAMQRPEAKTEMLLSVFMPLLNICPQEALPYCQWMAEHTPDDAMSLLILGCAQALQKQYKAAEAAFDRARILAKAAKDTGTEQLAREFRRNVYDPEFAESVRGMFAMAGQSDSLDLELDDFEL